MSDTTDSQNLASAATFDARLKAADEPRWLAARYAPRAGREQLVAFALLRLEMQRALIVSQPMLGKIRLQWWRESFDSFAGPAPRRHDLALELARVTRGGDDLLEALRAMADAYDAVLDDHLAEGHSNSAAHTGRHAEAEAAVLRAAGRALKPALREDEAAVLGACAAAGLFATARLEGWREQFAQASERARTLPPALWPAIAHLAALRHDAGGALSQRMRILRAVATKRL